MVWHIHSHLFLPTTMQFLHNAFVTLAIKPVSNLFSNQSSLPLVNQQKKKKIAYIYDNVDSYLIIPLLTKKETLSLYIYIIANNRQFATTTFAYKPVLHAYYW